MAWAAPLRPVEYAEQTLITAFLDGRFPAGAFLPAERELATLLGITRPTLREALRRLESDGWISVQQGKPTVVNDFWRDGGLNILAGIVRYSQQLPPDFIPNLLQVRLDLAPTYTRRAVESAPAAVLELLQTSPTPDRPPEDFASFDWKLQCGLTIASGNPIYALILNSFGGFYEPLARIYFALPESRDSSHNYYQSLRATAEGHDGAAAEQQTRAIMQSSITLWQRAAGDNQK